MAMLISKRNTRIRFCEWEVIDLDLMTFKVTDLNRMIREQGPVGYRR